MLQTRLPCPRCRSHNVIKNGSTHHKKQKYECKVCDRQFIEYPQKKVITLNTRNLIYRLLLEKISFAEIARSVQVSCLWLQTYVNQKYSQIPLQIAVSDRTKGKLTLEGDELWSFVGEKNNEL